MIDYEEASQILYGIGDGSISKDELSQEQKNLLGKVFNDLFGFKKEKVSDYM